MTLIENRLLNVVTQPAAEPVTLAEAKTYLRVTVNDDDTLIQSLIAAARQSAEEYLRRSLVTQTLKISLQGDAYAVIALPRGPVQSVTSVTAVARDDSTAVISASGYYLSASKEQVEFDAYVSAHRVEVVYVAGYGAASAVPDAIKQGILAHVSKLYDCRGEGDRAMPVTSRALFEPYRVVRV